MKILVDFGRLIEKYWWIALGFGALLFFALVLTLSSGQPIWFDEGYSILLARQSYGELLSLTAVDAHPPLYYLLLKFWGDIFGFSELALRSLSATLMSGAVIVAALTVRRMFSTRVMLFALPALILAPFLLRYGYEVRMYALATLIAVSATYALLRARSAKTWHWWAVYAVLVAAGMYTLYMMVAVWFAHFVWLLVVSLRSKSDSLWKMSWIYAFAGAVVLFLPYIKTFIHQLTHSALPGMGNEMTVPQLTNIASTLTLYTPEWSLGGWGSIVIVAFIVTVSLFGVRAYKKLKIGEKRHFMLIVALSFIPIVFYALTSLPPRDPIFIVRYMAHSSIFIYMLIGVITALTVVAKRSGRRSRIWNGIGLLLVAVVLTSGVVLLGRAGNFNFERMQQPLTHDVRDAARCNDSSTVVVADDPYTYIDSTFYFQDCDLRFFSKNDVAYAGGYAMLHESKLRVASPLDINAPEIVHLGWKGAEPRFKPDARYQLVGTDTFDKQVVTRYVLIEE